MKRYLIIYWRLIQINFTLLFTYRANFYNSLIITVGWGIVSISSIFLITSRVSHVYSWSRQELYLLAGMYSIIIGIFHTFFSSSLERFGQTISLGELDSFLLTPIDTQAYLSTKFFRPVSFLRILIGFIFTIFVSLHLPGGINPFMIFTSAIFILLGVVVLYSIWFLVVVSMIWNPNLSNLIDLLFISSNLGRYPPELITSSRNIFLYLFLPLVLIAAVPSRFIIGRVSIAEALGLFIFSICLFALSRMFWKFALKSYASVNS